MKEQSTIFDDPSTSPQVQTAYHQLHTVIDNLDTHVQQLIRRHQSQFILAYRNHLIKVKDQLSILKRKAEEQERMTSGVTKINKLQRQVALFREQALKVYSKLQQKTKQYEQYKAKYIQADENNIRNQQIIKDLSRRLKNVQIKNKDLQSQLKNYHELQQNQIEFNDQKQQPNNNPKQKQTKPISSHKSMRMTGMISQSNLTIQQALKSVFPQSTQETINLAYEKIHKIIKQRQHILTTRLQNYKNKQLMVQVVDSATMTSDLKQWFLQCIKTVKKQILKRNPNIQKQRKQIENVKNISEFLRIDKLRLLQLFVSDQKLLSFIYNKLFPDRVSQIKNFLSKKQWQQQQPNANQLSSPLENQFIQHFQDVDKPKVILPKLKKRKQSIVNRIVIKNGKLNLNS